MGESCLTNLLAFFFLFFLKKLPLAKQDIFGLIFEPQLYPYHSLRQIGVGLKSYFKITNFQCIFALYKPWNI